MSIASRLLCLVLPTATLTLLTGCTQLNLKKPTVWPFASEEKPGEPVRIACVWTDAVKYTPNEMPTRGFGGRLMFYGKEGTDPIKVDGTLVVYAFDESNRAASDARPDRKYVFTAESLALRHNKTDIGNSYSVWLPWDDAGQERKEISLIVRFLPANGPPLISEQTRQFLPGTEPQAIAQQETPATPAGGAMADGAVRPTSYEVPASSQNAANAGPASRMATATITVPTRFGQARTATTVIPQSAPTAVPQQVYPAYQPAAVTASQTTLAPQVSLQPEGRSAPGRFQAPEGQVGQRMRDRIPTQQRPTKLPYGQ